MNSKVLKAAACAIAAALVVGTAGCGGGTESSSGWANVVNTADYPFYEEEYESMTYSDADYKENMSRPYWYGNVLYNEIALPLSYESGEAYAKLLYTPLKVIEVRDQTLKKTYTEGTDYIVDAANKRLVIPEGSSIPLLWETADEGINVPEGFEQASAPDNYTKYVIWDLGSGPLVYTESSLFYGRYLCVTYAYDLSGLPSDIFNTYDATMLMNVRRKLEADEDITLAVIGDSITEGCSSTGDNLKVEPYTPGYANQLKAEIERVYGVNVTIVNSAKGGTLSYWPLSGEGEASLRRAIDAVPDLCVIAYGMNDSSATPATSPFAYQTNIEDIMLQIKAASPDCDFLLVNSFPSNPRYRQEANIFDRYLEKLQALSEKYNDGSVKVINMQKVGKYFMETKKYCEISSSNVNHPNDFMHRVYAMNLMTAISDYKG